MNKTTCTVTKYDCGNGYFVEVSGSEEENGYKEFWLYNQDYSIKRLMFGLTIPDDEVERMIEANLEEHIEDYQQDFE